MSDIVMYGANWCPYCQRAEQFLQRKGLSVDKRNVDADEALRAEMLARSGRRSVPQIFLGDLHIGGHDELLALERSGALDRLLGEHGAANGVA